MISLLGSTSPSTSNRWLWLLPRLAFLLFVGAVIGLLWLSDRAEQDEQKATLISDVLWLEQNLRFHLSHNEELLAQIGPLQAGSVASFELHGNALLSNRSGLRQIRWLEVDGTITRAMPPKPDGHSPNDAIRLATSVARPIYGNPYRQGGSDWTFDVTVPIFHSGKAAGFVIGSYSLQQIIDQLVPWWLAERYRIVIVDDAGQELAARSKVEAPPTDSGYQLLFEPPGHGLSIIASPYRMPAPVVGHLLSAALLILATVVLWSLWLLRRHDQKRLLAEHALLEEHNFRTAMENSVQTGLRARDLSGRITFVNPAFCRMVGWDAADLVGRAPPMPYWIESEIETTQALHDQILAGDGPARGFEIWLKRRNGEVFPALIHEAPLVDPQGRQTGWMSSVVDISDQKRAQDLARQQHERLQATSRLVAMGEMASSLAHELNQPLAAIASYNAGCLNLLRARREQFTEIEAALSKSLDQAQRAGRIIRRIYEFVRRAEPKAERCDIGSLLEETIALVDADARRHEILMVRHIESELPPVRGDRILLGQAFLNIVRNAIDALRELPPDRRRISLSAFACEGQVQVAIADQGSGIATEIAGRLFEPFFTTKPEGMGMGLNICRSVIEGHRGRLWFEPNSGGGSIFRILLPSAPP